MNRTKTISDIDIHFPNKVAETNIMIAVKHHEVCKIQLQWKHETVKATKTTNSSSPKLGNRYKTT